MIFFLITCVFIMAHKILFSKYVKVLTFVQMSCLVAVIKLTFLGRWSLMVIKVQLFVWSSVYIQFNLFLKIYISTSPGGYIIKCMKRKVFQLTINNNIYDNCKQQWKVAFGREKCLRVEWDSLCTTIGNIEEK